MTSSNRDPGLGAAFERERAETIRTRSRWIWGVSILVWVTSFVLVDGAVFTRAQALSVRGPEIALAVASLVWLRKPRSLGRIEIVSVLGWALIATVSGLGFLVIPVDKLPAKVASLELSALLVCLLGGFTWRANLGVAALALLALSGLPFIGATELYTLSLTVVGFGYGVLIVSAAARDRLALAELAARRGLASANEQLKHEDELKRRLFVNLSHDLRTPLAVIRGEAALLRDRDREGTDDAALARVERNAIALAELADQLLDLARLDAGQMPVKARACDVNSIAKDVAAQLGQDRVTVIGDPGVARVDPAHAARILGNLVANALRQEKATGEPAAVTIAIARTNGVIRADVVDDGPGVPASRRDAIFTRFVSFDSDGSTASGIGLPLARELAIANGGSLALTDEPKTTFRLELPATDEAPEPLADKPLIERTPPEARAANGASRSPALRRLLVVEDNADMGALLVRTFEATFRVEHVTGVVDARAALDRETPAVVLSDVMLPDGTGYDVLAFIRARKEWAALPVVLVSARGEVDERVRGLAAGADDYLAKPFAPGELLRRITTAVERAEGWKKSLDAQRDTLLMEVHDGVSASLSRAHILLAELPDESVTHARDAIRDGLDEVRAITRLLAPRPADFTALAAELRRAMADGCAAAKLELVFESENLVTGASVVPAAIAHTLRRVAREATTNTIKHAGATTITCRLTARDGAIALSVEDDGRGFPANTQTGQGLGIMGRRVARVGGTVTHGPRDGGGARIAIELPLSG